jgi:hypothetical protein
LIFFPAQTDRLLTFEPQTDRLLSRGIWGGGGTSPFARPLTPIPALSEGVTLEIFNKELGVGLSSIKEAYGCGLSAGSIADLEGSLSSKIASISPKKSFFWGDRYTIGMCSRPPTGWLRAPYVVVGGFYMCSCPTHITGWSGRIM